MKEKPILFSGPMVRAILEGRKTMTRRVIKLGPAWYDDDGKLRNTQHWEGRELINMVPCPYGQPGDRLWVRETWAANIPGCPNGLTYRADHLDPKGDGPANPIHWRPSIYMPRWASRLTLEITGVRVERVQEISEEDVRAEGLYVNNTRDGSFYHYNKSVPAGKWWIDPVDAYHQLWDGINAKRPGCSWQDNPWVWMIEFKTIGKVSIVFSSKQC